MERELRRYQNLLVCVGTGVITFGIWTVIKAIMTLVIQKDEIVEMATFLLSNVYGLEITESECYVLIVIFVSVIAALDLLLRLTVGTSARKDGMSTGKSKFRAYPVFGVILAIVASSSLISNFRSVLDVVELVQAIGTTEAYLELSGQILDLAVATFIDVTSLIMVLQMLVAAVKVRTLRRRIEEAGRKEGSLE